MTLFHYLHGNLQLTGWGAFWLMAAAVTASGSVVVRR